MSLPSNWIQSDGKWYAPVREFTCPEHPYGPPDVDEYDPIATFALAILKSLTVHGYPELAADARRALGLCCAAHEWIETGEMREVGALELFMYSAMPAPIKFPPAVLAEWVNEIPWRSFAGEPVRIPIITSAKPQVDACPHCKRTCPDCLDNCERCNE